MLLQSTRCLSPRFTAARGQILLGRDRRLAALALALLPLLFPLSAVAVDGDIIESHTEVTPMGLVAGELAGESVARIDDFPALGQTTLALGRPGAAGSVAATGAVDLLFLDATGAVTGSTTISDAAVDDPLDVLDLANGDRFGQSLASLGDMDGDGRIELAIGADRTDTGAGSNAGAVWIVDLALGTGQPEAATRIDDTDLTPGSLGGADQFGYALAAIGDWNQDGVPDLAVGADGDDDGGGNHGAVYILYLASDGSVLSEQKISDTAGGFDGAIGSFGRFGSAITLVADQQADGRPDLAVGAPGPSSVGIVWLLQPAPGCFASTPTCTIDTEIAITQGTPGFSGAVSGTNRFGEGLAFLPASSPFDYDRLLIGAPGDPAEGTVWMLDLANGVVSSTREIGDEQGWPLALASTESLGSGLSTLGDLDGDGFTDFAMGARGGFGLTGRAFTALTSPCPSLILRPVVYHSPDDMPQDPCAPVPLPTASTTDLNLYIESGGIASPLAACDDTAGGGTEMCAFDVRLEFESGIQVLAFSSSLVGLDYSDPASDPSSLRLNWVSPSSPENGAVRLGTVSVSNDLSGNGVVRIGAGSAAVGASLQLQTIGQDVIALPEPAMLPSAAVGVLALFFAAHASRRRDTARSRRDTLCVGSRQVFSGALIALVLLFTAGTGDAAQSIKSQTRISEGESLMGSNSSSNTNLGESLAAPGDVDADGTPDLVAGCCATFGLFPTERLYTFFLDDAGDPAAPPATSPSMGDGLRPLSMTAIPDRDGDGRNDLLIGTRPSGGNWVDRVWMAFLNSNGTLKSSVVEYGDGLGGFPAGLLAAGGSDEFGHSVAWLGDVDGDPSTREFAVGTPGDDDAFTNSGAVWILSIDDTDTVVDQQKLTAANLGFEGSQSFGVAIGALGDLDANGVNDLAISMPSCRGIDATQDVGCIGIVLLEPGAGTDLVQAVSTVFLSEGENGVPDPLASGALRIDSLVWHVDLGAGLGGVLVAGDEDSEEVWLLRLRADGTLADYYTIFDGAGVGESLYQNFNDAKFGYALASPGDLDGDEVRDLVVSARLGQAARGGGGSVAEGSIFILRMIDSDFDQLDDNLDNCPGGPGVLPALSYNPDQTDRDSDGVGDLCDVCPDVPDPLQADADGDGRGDLCEPVVLSLRPTGTTMAPTWDFMVECGAYAVDEINIAVIPPESAVSPAFALGCPAAPPGGQCGSFDSVDSTVSGLGLMMPAGVRDDAYYLHVEGDGPDPICDPLDLPSKLGELTTGGSSLAAASLSEEGIEAIGLNLEIAQSISGPIPDIDIELAVGAAVPRARIELGPAFVDNGRTRWDVLLRDAGDRFHRVTFGLVAAVGTSPSDLVFEGCSTATAEPGDVRTCGGGVGPTVNAANSWTVGPSTPASTPAGLRQYTMYVVLEGDRAFGLFPPFLNTPPSTVQLGTIEVTGTPDLEPALTLEGVDLIDDRLATGAITPWEISNLGSLTPLTDLDEIELIGEFNPAEDIDTDGIQDLADNCPFRPNFDQADSGGFQTTMPDTKGNACQCGDGSGDGSVDESGDPAQNDLVQIRDFLLGRIAAPLDAEVAERCSVAGTPECNIRDLVILQKAFDATVAAESRCDASLAPAPPSP